MALGWTAMRIWLGVMWIQGRRQAVGRGEPRVPAQQRCLGGRLAAHGAPAYSWWGHFLTGFVVPNASWIAVLIAVAEFAVGIALCLGLFTRVAALGSLALLFTYVMSGTASVCAWYALFAIVILTMWRTASWLGVDGLVASYRQHHAGQHTAIHLPWSRSAAGTAGTVHKTA